MWLLYSLLALLFWSGSDLFSKAGSRPDDKLSHWKMVIAVGLFMGLHAGYEIVFGGVSVNWEAILRYLPASALYIGSMVIGYVGLRYIELSVSSPICNSSGAIASLFLIVFFFDMAEVETGLPLLATLTGILFCGAGVVLLAVVDAREDMTLKLARRKASNIKYTASVLAILLPILYCLIDAAGTVADAFILETLDENVANVAYELTFLAMGVFAAIYVYGVRREKPVFRREWPKGVAGVMETAGQFAYIFAIGANAVASAPIISCYCALSVVWSRIFLKEKLSFSHYVAVIITIIGIALLGVFGGA